MGPKSGIEGLPLFDTWKPDIRANYGGSDRKSGLISLDGTRYMVKYSEKRATRNDLATNYVNNVVSAVPRIRDAMPAVREFIDDCSFLSDTRKDFYNVMLAERMAFVLDSNCGTSWGDVRTCRRLTVRTLCML